MSSTCTLLDLSSKLLINIVVRWTITCLIFYVSTGTFIDVMTSKRVLVFLWNVTKYVIYSQKVQRINFSLLSSTTNPRNLHASLVENFQISAQKSQIFYLSFATMIFNTNLSDDSNENWNIWEVLLATDIVDTSYLSVSHGQAGIFLFRRWARLWDLY